MTLKAPRRFVSLEEKDAPDLNRTLVRVFQAKIESLHKNENSGIGTFGYQSIEHGEVDFSHTGSATITKTYSLKEKQNKIVYANAHACNNLGVATITDVTQTAVTIVLRTVSGTANLSSVITASVKVFYQVIGSNP